MRDDLIVKLAAVAGGVLLVGWLANRAAGAVSGAAGEAWDGVTGALGTAWNSAAQGLSAAGDFVGEQASTTFNPASDQNFIYRGVNSLGAAASGDQSWTLGGALYDANAWVERTYGINQPKPAPSGPWAPPSAGTYAADGYGPPYQPSPQLHPWEYKPQGW